MDWTPYMSGIFALVGAFTGGIFPLFAQGIAQWCENKRALRRLAYDAALKHWSAQGFGKNGERAALMEFLRFHFTVIDNLALPVGKRKALFTKELHLMERDLQAYYSVHFFHEEKGGAGDSSAKSEPGKGE